MERSRGLIFGSFLLVLLAAGQAYAVSETSDTSRVTVCVCHKDGINPPFTVCPSNPGVLQGHLNHGDSPYGCECGDHKCSPELGENAQTCPQDCSEKPSVCGNSVVESGEDCDGGACCNGDCTFNSGNSCDDADACTKTDKCQQGVCVGHDSVSCSALDQCHGVGTCDTQTGLCSNPQKDNGSSCSDGDVCTSQEETCQEGICSPGAPVSCDDANPCTDDSACDSLAGCTHTNVPNGTSCSDGNACNGEETCKAGSCRAGTPPAEICDGIDNNCNGQVDEGFPDTDHDGIADCVDSDIDNDGVANAQDNCPKFANADQTDTNGNQIGDACEKTNLITGEAGSAPGNGGGNGNGSGNGNSGVGGLGRASAQGGSCSLIRD